MTRIFDELVHEITSHTHHQHYHASNDQPPEAAMSLLDTIRSEIAAAVTWGEDEIRARLPTIARLADYAEAAASSPLVQAALSAVLPPAVEQSLAEMIAKVDAELHAAGQRAQAAMPGPAALAGAEPPADDFAVPAGPVVGGQA